MVLITQTNLNVLWQKQEKRKVAVFYHYMDAAFVYSLQGISQEFYSFNERTFNMESMSCRKPDLMHNHRSEKMAKPKDSVYLNGSFQTKMYPPPPPPPKL